MYCSKNTDFLEGCGVSTPAQVNYIYTNLEFEFNSLGSTHSKVSTENAILKIHTVFLLLGLYKFMYLWTTTYIESGHKRGVDPELP